MAEENCIDRVNETPLRKIAYPLIIENLLFLAFSSIDIFMLSKYSDKAVAAVGLTTQYTWFILVLLQVIPNGAAILLTNFLGAGRTEKAKSISRTALQMIVVFGLFFGAVFAFSVPQILKRYSIDTDVRQFASQYVFICSLFSVFSGISIVQSSILRSYGHTRDAMIVNAVANLLNIAGNALALYGFFGLPVLGVRGVAIATVASQLAGAAILSVRIMSLSDCRYSAAAPFRIDFSEWKQILRIGIPSAGESLSWNLSQMVIMVLITTFGTAALAAFTYLMTILRFVYMIAISIGTASQIKTGHYCGAGLQETAYKNVFRYQAAGSAVSLTIATLIFVFRTQVTACFTQNKAIAAVILSVMPVIFFLELGRSVNVIIIPCLMAAGDIHFPVGAGIFSNWIISVMLSYIFALLFGWGFPGVIIAMACDEMLRGTLMLFRWKSKVWMRKKIV
ncbi:MATE family efflux transporter [Treponema sp.]|uniref:MATE family efflux transporter n=1 Tax=Treponema sp. TaxID=166 RepID=UPI003F0A0B93